MNLGADLKDFINHNQKQIFDGLARRFDEEVRTKEVGTEKAKTEEVKTWELKAGELKTGELKTEAVVGFKYENTYNTIVKTERINKRIFVPLIESDVTGVIDYISQCCQKSKTTRNLEKQFFEPNRKIKKKSPEVKIMNDAILKTVCICRSLNCSDKKFVFQNQNKAPEPLMEFDIDTLCDSKFQEEYKNVMKSTQNITMLILKQLLGNCGLTDDYSAFKILCAAPKSGLYSILLSND